MKFIYPILITLFLITTAGAEELVPLTRTLNGVSITYDYTNGRSYGVRFEEAGASYQFLSGSKPDKWWGPFPYQAFEIEKDVFMAAWFEEGYGDYVTLLINFNNNLIYGSAILSGKDVHFHGAKLTGISGK